MSPRPTPALAGLLLASALAAAPWGPGCGPVVAPPDDAGVDAEAGRLDVCARPDAPDFCRDAGDAGDAPPDAPPSTCAGGKPDGRCLPAAEGCGCSDCAATALCTGACSTDDSCDLAAGEDCSCPDCDGKVAGCAPAPVGCKNDGICSLLTDDCTCPDCQGDRDCQQCVVNGFCAEYTESCTCPDCSASPRCLPDGG